MAFELKLPWKKSGGNPKTVISTNPVTMVGRAGPATMMAGYNPNTESLSLAERMETAAHGQARPLPLIGHLNFTRQLQVLGGLLAACLLMSLLFVLMHLLEVRRHNAQLDALVQMQTLSQRLARGGTSAQMGDKKGFDLAAQSRTSFDALLSALSSGGVVGDVSIDAMNRSGSMGTELASLEEKWKGLRSSLDGLGSSQASLTGFSGAVQAINLANPRLLELTEQLSAQIGGGAGSARESAAASQMVMLTQRLAKNANALLGEEIDNEAAFVLGKDALTFKELAKALREGNESLRLQPLRDPQTRATLDELDKTYGQLEPKLNSILQGMQGLVNGKVAAQKVSSETDGLFVATSKLREELLGRGQSNLGLWLAGLFGLLSLGLLGLILKLFFDDVRRRSEQLEAENARKQQAILRLLNEISTLADGDLTVKTTVTEEETGAIADSINFTVDELRQVVRGINSSSDQVNEATNEAQQISVRMLESTQKQAGEIQRASSLVLSMAQSINDVSASAAQSSRVAQLSLGAADQGARAVQNQIGSMNEIRGQIQETAKRIKRLGESSQEIGQITELISDITEQTNVLALNAAIQAASAGEAGRGFSVVAEEVQRLAERSAGATRQIEALVKTIQADTQDAVAAMERSTQGVVEGTKLSDAAGNSLGEIRRVSRELAELIANISGQTQRQAASVSEVTRNMQDILAVTEDSSRSSRQTTVQINKLAEIAQNLRSSVSGFKV